MAPPESLTAITAFAVSGILVGYLYCRFQRLRESSAVHGATVLLMLPGLAVCARSSTDLSVSQLSFEGFLLLGASLCHLPTAVYILLFQWNRLLEHLTSPGRRDGDTPPQRTSKEEWKVATRHLEALRENAVDPYHRRQLAESYLRLGLLDSAIGEFRKAIECADRGYEHAYLLFKTARLLVDGKDDVPAALPLLRRTIRLYPRSYFAAYARRIVNHHDARRARHN